jgi:hypothetical protein
MVFSLRLISICEGVSKPLPDSKGLIDCAIIPELIKKFSLSRGGHTSFLIEDFALFLADLPSEFLRAEVDVDELPRSAEQLLEFVLQVERSALRRKQQTFEAFDDFAALIVAESGRQLCYVNDFVKLVQHL